MVASIHLQTLTPPLTSSPTYDKLLPPLHRPPPSYLHKWHVHHQACRSLNEPNLDETWHIAQHQANPLWRQGITTKMNSVKQSKLSPLHLPLDTFVKADQKKKILCDRNYITKKGFLIIIRNNRLNKWLIGQSANPTRPFSHWPKCMHTDARERYRVGLIKGEFCHCSECTKS